MQSGSIVEKASPVICSINEINYSQEATIQQVTQ